MNSRPLDYLCKESESMKDVANAKTLLRIRVFFCYFVLAGSFNYPDILLSF